MGKYLGSSTPVVFRENICSSRSRGSLDMIWLEGKNAMMGPLKNSCSCED